jgi:hypothetical protein
MVKISNPVIMNLTHFEIILKGKGGSLSLAPAVADRIAQLVPDNKPFAEVQYGDFTIELTERDFKSVTNLPPQKPGVFYIVYENIRRALHRKDLLSYWRNCDSDGQITESQLVGSPDLSVH